MNTPVVGSTATVTPSAVVKSTGVVAGLPVAGSTRVITSPSGSPSLAKSIPFSGVPTVVCNTSSVASGAALLTADPGVFEVIDVVTWVCPRRMSGPVVVAGLLSVMLNVSGVSFSVSTFAAIEKTRAVISPSTGAVNVRIPVVESNAKSSRLATARARASANAE